MSSAAAAGSAGVKRLRDDDVVEDVEDVDAFDVEDVEDDDEEGAAGDYEYDDFEDDPAEQALLRAAYALDVEELGMVTGKPTSRPKKARKGRAVLSKEELAANRWMRYRCRTAAATDE